MAVAYGMAVLMVRILCCMFAFILCEKINWNKVVKQGQSQYAYPLYIFVSISFGHLLASFIISIIDLLRDILYSMFL